MFIKLPQQWCLVATLVISKATLEMAIANMAIAIVTLTMTIPIIGSGIINTCNGNSNT